jgi:predicted nucleic acid-binding protein
MIAYLDASVLLRVVLGQRNRLAEWKKVRIGVASALTQVECLRTLDRLQLHGASANEIAIRRETVHRLMERIELVEPTSIILHRAAQPMPVPLGTLDAIHLSTALLWPPC